MEQEKNNNRSLRIVIITICLIIAFLAGFFSHYIFRTKNVTLATDIVKIMEQVGFVYDEKTGEKRPITEEEIADALVSGLFDKHSAYYTKEEYDIIEQEDNGNKAGVGLGFYDKDNVIDVVEFNSPADLVGIKTGDKIVGCSFGQESVTITDKQSFTNFIKPLPVDGQIEITIERNAQEQTFTLKKAEYICALIEYRDNQTPFTSVHEFKLEADEYINDFIIRFETEVTEIGFVTNKGRTEKWGGQTGELKITHLTGAGKMVRGIFGAYTDVLGCCGVLYTDAE